MLNALRHQWLGNRCAGALYTIEEFSAQRLAASMVGKQGTGSTPVTSQEVLNALRHQWLGNDLLAHFRVPPLVLNALRHQWLGNRRSSRVEHDTSVLNALRHQWLGNRSS